MKTQLSAVQQLTAELDAVQQGHCWIGYNANEILDGISFKTATQQAFKGGNTIWQIVNHISFWRELVAERIMERKDIEGEQTGMDAPAEVSEKEWQQTLKRFDKAYNLLRNAITQLNDNELDNIVGKRDSLRFTINGSLQHDAFHLGQILLLKRMAGHK